VTPNLEAAARARGSRNIGRTDAYAAGGRKLTNLDPPGAAL